VLLHGGEAHRVDVGEPGHRRLLAGAAPEDVAARRVGEGMEEVVDLLAGQLTYNHPVVGYMIARRRLRALR
jgi:hypothetical protein